MYEASGEAIKGRVVHQERGAEHQEGGLEHQEGGVKHQEREMEIRREGRSSEGMVGKALGFSLFYHFSPGHFLCYLSSSFCFRHLPQGTSRG